MRWQTAHNTVHETGVSTTCVSNEMVRFPTGIEYDIPIMSVEKKHHRCGYNSMLPLPHQPFTVTFCLLWMMSCRWSLSDVHSRRRTEINRNDGSDDDYGDRDDRCVSTTTSTLTKTNKKNACRPCKESHGCEQWVSHCDGNLKMQRMDKMYAGNRNKKYHSIIPLSLAVHSSGQNDHVF